MSRAVYKPLKYDDYAYMEPIMLLFAKGIIGNTGMY